jgi:ATP-dependent Clp protease adapter protein ClpS
MGAWYRHRVSPATLTPPRERTTRGTGTSLGKPWRVVVLNDNHNTFQGVAAALSSTIPNVSYEQGLRIADRIHNTGARSFGPAIGRRRSSTGSSYAVSA